MLPCMETRSIPTGKAFVPLPRALCDALLCGQDKWGLGRRDILLLLLIARLTYGCRGTQWACLAPADLAAIGIGRGHARAYLRRLLTSGLVERNGERDQYRLLSALPSASAGDKERTDRLSTLVGAHLARQEHAAKPIPAPLVLSPPLSSAPSVPPASADTPRPKPLPARARPVPAAPARARPSKAVNYADPGDYASGAGRHWHFDKAQQRWWRDKPSVQSRPVCDAFPPLGQMALEVFASPPPCRKESRL